MPRTTPRRRILIFQGDQLDAPEYAARLESLGYEAMVAAGSLLDQTVVRAADLVMLPLAHCDGVAAAQALRQRGMPVVFMAADVEEAERCRGWAGVPFDYLVAPVGDRELRVVVELALCRADAARAGHDLDGFFSVSADMFCFLDFSGYFKRLNPAWERTLGFTAEEMMSRPFIEFVHPDDRERTLGQNRDVRGGGRASGFENRYLCRDGSYRWLLWNSAPALEGGVIYAVARDITERKQAEDERARLVAELQTTLAEVRTLQEIIPICSYCRKIRDDQDYWESVEEYIARHTRTRFSHGICPDCMASEVEPQLNQMERNRPEA